MNFTPADFRALLARRDAVLARLVVVSEGHAAQAMGFKPRHQHSESQVPPGVDEMADLWKPSREGTSPELSLYEHYRSRFAGEVPLRVAGADTSRLLLRLVASAERDLARRVGRAPDPSRELSGERDARFLVQYEGEWALAVAILEDDSELRILRLRRAAGREQWRGHRVQAVAA